MLEKSRGMACEAVTGDVATTLTFTGGSMRAEAALAPVFEYLAEASALRAVELPTLDCATYDRSLLARQLVASGVFRVAGVVGNGGT
jgi:hypothetical protein